MAELIIALDVPQQDKALALADGLQGVVPWCKVGMELFTLAGPSLLAELKKMGFRVFLDLKFYDIPHTVGQAVKAAAAVGVDLLTLHCQGGERMCREARAAVEGLSVDAPSRPLLFGVTVLTSFAAGEMPGIDADPADHALELAKDAAKWGLDGVVCSGQEASSIKSLWASSHISGMRCLCPGIRPVGSDSGDQRRIMTPSAAVKAGADFLVVGRPILAAPSPLEAARRILVEMDSAQQQR